MTITTYQRTVTMATETCCNCGVLFGMPLPLQETFQNDPDKYFYCPNGHSQHYSESTEQKLRKEAERKLREKENELIRAANNRLELERDLKKSRKDLKRLQSGVCTCCKRTFTNLKQHMETQHPEVLCKPPYKHPVKK